VKHRELLLEVDLQAGRLSTRAVLDGRDLGRHRAVVPRGLGSVWEALRSDRTEAEVRLTAAGTDLRGALLRDDWIQEVADVIDGLPLGTVLDVVIETEGSALALPYELLRLPGGPLATLPAVGVIRRLRGRGRDVAQPMPGPLKILVAVGAPHETGDSLTEPLDIEREMQAVLEAVGGLGHDRDAGVRILEVGSLDQIAAALEVDSYQVLHLAARGSPSSIELEDEDGNPIEVAAEDLIGRLHATMRRIPVIVLPSSAGGAEGAGGLAATLVANGADRVVAMQASVTDIYATRLVREMYRVLAAHPPVSVAVALGEARRRQDAERQRNLRRGGGPSLPEYGVATLFAAGTDPPLWDQTATPEPLSRRTVAPGGGSVRELSMDQLIGRRRELREALAILRRDPGTTEKLGASSGVVLTGIGGIGKTALAGRLINRLREEGWVAAVHAGRWSPPSLFDAVADAIEGVGSLSVTRNRLVSDDVDDLRKLSLIGRILSRHQLLLVFDDFEQNLQPGGGGYLDPGLPDLLQGLSQMAIKGRLLFTCRHRLPDGDSLLVRPIDLAPLSPGELGRLFLRMPALRDLSWGDLRMVARTIGGHPRLIEFVDSLLRHGATNLTEVAFKLRSLAAKEGVDLEEERSVDQAMSDAILLGSRDILLEALLARAWAEDRELVLQAAITLLPLSIEELAVARWGFDQAPGRIREVARGVDRLLDLTLLSKVGDGSVLVLPWTAEALARHQGDGARERHARALEMRTARLHMPDWHDEGMAQVPRHFAALGFTSVVNRISAILFKADPIGINFGHNSDEYDSEAETIVLRLIEGAREEDISRVVHEEFERWFGDLSDEDVQYVKIAREIWEAWRAFGHSPDHTPHT
jgi:hypothetical protein